MLAPVLRVAAPPEKSVAARAPGVDRRVGPDPARGDASCMMAALFPATPALETTDQRRAAPPARQKESAMTRSAVFLLLAVLVAGSACATAPPAPDTLKKVKDSGTLTIGYRDSSVAFSFLGSDDKPAGHSVDLCKR